MAEDSGQRHKPHKRAATPKSRTRATARKPAKNAVADREKERGARILVVTDDPHRSVIIVPGCHIDSMRDRENAYFFEDGNQLVGMIVEGGTVEYHSGERTYVVRLTDGRPAGTFSGRSTAGGSAS
ncbi:hypothetical protein ASG82_25490 [Mycobacterium sp. Soil538]|nr:hypothetical protein ASG82_25490 [Mycobacterium sp. Soil538]